MTPGRTPRALVVGIGNPERGDDGIGAEVARLVDALQLGGVQVAHYREPVELLDEPIDANIMIVVDAVSSGAAAGTVVVREVAEDPLPEWVGIGGTHAVGLGAVIELVRTLGRLPPRTVLVGVEANAFAAGRDFSTPVRNSLPKAVDAVVALVQEHA